MAQFDVQKFVQSGFDASMLGSGAAGLTEAAQAVVDNEELFGFAGNKAPVKAAQEALFRAGEAGKLQTAIDLFGDAQGYQDFITGVDAQLSSEGRLSVENRKQAIAEKVGFADVNALSLGEGQTFQSKLEDELARGTSFLTGAAQPFAFQNFQSKFAEAQSELSSKLANVGASVANLLDIPAGTDPAVVAELESRAQTLLDENASDQEMANQLGIDVPTAQKLRGAFVSSAEVGEQQFAVGRSGRALKGQENPDGTWDIVDSNTGEVVESGFADATALRPRLTELQSASVPDEVGAFAEAVGVTDTPAGASLMDVVNATDGSLSSNKEFVNGAFQAFLGRDATQAELDQFTGQSVDAVRNALQAGATGTVTDADVSIDDSFVETFDSTFIDDALSDPVTDSDISSMLSDMQEQQQGIIDALAPTDVEQDLQQQLVDFKTSFELGLAEIEDQPIALEFITGQQASLEKRAVALESNLLMRLGLAQDERAATLQAAQTQLGFTQANMDTVIKMKQLAQAEEESIFNRAQALKGDARDTLLTILDTLQGVDPSLLSTEQKSQLFTLAESAGIPFELVTAGLDNVFSQTQIDEFGGLTIGDQYDLASDLFSDGKYDTLADALTAVGAGVEGVADITTVEGYTDWLSSTGLGTVTQSWEVDHNGGTGWHALDIDGAVGDPIISPVTGTITEITDESSGWGNSIVVTDASGNEWRLAHFDSLGDGIGVGSSISLGQSVGGLGNTGDVRDMNGNSLSEQALANGQGSHLHLEVKDSSGNYVDPRTMVESTREVELTSGQQSIVRMNELAQLLLSSDSLDRAVGPKQSGIPQILISKGVSDFRVRFEELINAMTVDNLDLLTGVLSDSDLALLRSVSSGLDLAMSEDALRDRLSQIVRKTTTDFTIDNLNFSPTSSNLSDLDFSL